MADGTEGSEYIDREDLHSHLREETELQVGTDARNLLAAQLDNLTSCIWHQAAIYAQNRGAKRVQEKDVENAFDDLVYHNDQIEQAANEVKSLEKRLKKISSQTPLYARYENEK